MNRRHFLALIGVFACSGCLSERFGTDTATPECKVAKSKLSAKRVTPSSDQREYIVALQFDDLPSNVQPVFESAVENGTVVGDCPTQTADGRIDRALSDAVRLVGDQRREQAQLHDGRDVPRWVNEAAFLQYEGEMYALRAFLSDVGVSSMPDFTDPSETVRSTELS